MDEVIRFLEENRPFYVATVDGDKPKVRPFGFFMTYEGRLYFLTGKHKKSCQQLIADPYVEISTDNGKGQWIRICGKAVFDDRPEIIAKVFETMPRLKDMYNDKTGFKPAPFYLAEAEAEIADMTGGFKKIALS